MLPITNFPFVSIRPFASFGKVFIARVSMRDGQSLNIEVRIFQPSLRDESNSWNDSQYFFGCLSLFF
jgi:hypothetical protein